MKWYKFEVKGRFNTKIGYIHFHDDISNDELKVHLESYASKMFGTDFGYSMNFEEVREPSREWIREKICYYNIEINKMQEELELLKAL